MARCGGWRPGRDEERERGDRERKPEKEKESNPPVSKVSATDLGIELGHITTRSPLHVPPR